MMIDTPFFLNDAGGAIDVAVLTSIKSSYLGSNSTTRKSDTRLILNPKVASLLHAWRLPEFCP